MSDFVKVATVWDIAEGEARAFQVGQEWVGVARSDGRLYAFRDECSHAECPLSRGLVEDGQIECECHGAMFDLRTGEATKPPAVRPVPVYEVREEQGDVLVAVPS
jgi:3-phenylpropionate/trans-cinnamate dioxygenase ferredoxin subunit